MPSFKRSANVAPNSYDAATNSVEVVFATEAPIDMGPFVESLRMTGMRTEMPFLPVLNSHDRSDVESILGTASDIRVVGAEARARVQFSKNNPKAQILAGDIRDGQPRSLSVGYRPIKFKDRKENGRTFRETTEWSVFELTFTSVPADPACMTRSEEDKTMPITREDIAALNARKREMFKGLGLSRSAEDAIIDSGCTEEEANALIVEALRNKPQQQIRTATPHNDVSFDNPETRRSAISEALYARANPAHKISDQARHFAGMTTVEISRAMLNAAGVNTVGMNAATVATRAMSTSDFPILMIETGNRSLMDGFVGASGGMMTVASNVSTPDFRSIKRISRSNFPNLSLKLEGAEYEYGAPVQAKEEFKIGTYGRMTGLTREAWINDDLGGFANILQIMGAAAGETVRELTALTVAFNGHMSDGKPFFDASRSNIAAVPGKLDSASLGAAVLAIRSQTGYAKEIISLEPKTLIVGPKTELAARLALAPVSATKTSDINPWSNAFTLIVDPHIRDDRWYLSCAPSGIELAWLNGVQAPHLESENSFSTDNMSFKVRLDFGVGLIEPREIYLNNGH